MKIYIVFEQYIHEEPRILKVFSSNEKASEFVKKIKMKKTKDTVPFIDIEEFEVE